MKRIPRKPARIVPVTHMFLQGVLDTYSVHHWAEPATHVARTMLRTGKPHLAMRKGQWTEWRFK